MHNFGVLRPLPSAEDLPYDLISVIIWTEDEDSEPGTRYSGKRYIGSSEGWYYFKDRRDVIPSGTEVDWELDGFQFGRFSRRWLLDEERKTPLLVKLALWALERWSKDVGLQDIQGDN